MKKIFLILALSFILFSTSSYAIIDLSFKNDRLIMPGQNQTLLVTFSKPTISEPIDVKIILEIYGPARFPNDKNIIELTYEKFPWEGTVFKRYIEEIPITVYNEGSESDAIIVNATMIYFNTMFGYKKTDSSNETKFAAFNVVWTLRDEELYNDLSELNVEYNLLRQEYQTLQKELGKQSELNQELKQKNSILDNQVKELKYNNAMMQFFRIMTIILALVCIGFLIYFRKKKK